VVDDVGIVAEQAKLAKELIEAKGALGLLAILLIVGLILLYRTAREAVRVWGSSMTELTIETKGVREALDGAFTRLSATTAESDKKAEQRHGQVLTDAARRHGEVLRVIDRSGVEVREYVGERITTLQETGVSSRPKPAA